MMRFGSALITYFHSEDMVTDDKYRRSNKKTAFFQKRFLVVCTGLEPVTPSM